ncbi:hypothetical protein [Longimicrobium sp.]|jgi:outer membrane biosynthesis protein TonB|uniref:hypothetical protein n=1 Tax=Longimicrobium sp. TaxID=2029185 RepID=UPI002ED986B9
MPGAVLASLALHGLAVVLMAFTGADPKPPKMKVYAVDIVSERPNVEGEPLPEAMANQEPGPIAPEPAPAAAAEPEPAPEPPAPEPEPAPPVPEKSAPKEPEKAPEPRKTPERPTPPRPTPPRPNPTPPRTTPSTPPRTTPSTPNRPPATQPGSGQSGTGNDASRSRGEGTRTGPATGRNADANSPGGEGLTISSRGVRCPTAGYCTNIVRQVRRFFRAPESASGGSGNVCFRIMRDGSVAEIATRDVRGGAAFRLALMEAAEQAGNRKAFGTLPAGFSVEELPVCVLITPEML